MFLQYKCLLFTAFVFCISFVIIKLRIEAKQNTENLTAKLQNSNQNSSLSWVSLIRLQELRFQGDLNLYVINVHH